MRIKYIFTTLICLAFVALITVLPFPKNKTMAANQQSQVNLNPSQGQKVGFVYEAFLNPNQEPDDEENTPKMAPAVFKSTAPSVPRTQRKSRGHGVLRFNNDLSKAFVDVQVEGVNLKDIVMFHIHCGTPDVLGPIIVDFGLYTNIQQQFADGNFSTEVVNENIEKTTNSGHDIVGAYTLGCPIGSGQMGKVRTVAGMERFARLNELYFNLHTKGQTFFGDIRGQLHPVQR